MGWWKIREGDGGGLDWDRAGAPDHPEDYVNGDGPTETVGDLATSVRAAAGGVGVAVTREELRRLLLKAEVPERLSAISTDLARQVLVAWVTVDGQYTLRWGRPAYAEERDAIVQFVLDLHFGRG